jgi:two-component system response regulator
MTGKSILLVEDNPDDVELTMRAFRNGNIHQDIRVARDGAEAFQSLFGSEDQPDPPPLPALVLLDLKLPGIDGFDVLRRIRADVRTRFLPVVILTSSTEMVDLVNGYWLGANSYVRKPVSFRDFLSTTQQIANYWLSLNEVPPYRS